MRALFYCVTLALTLAAAQLAATQAQAQRSQAEGFGAFNLQSAGSRDGYGRVRFSDGTRAERFILRAGDCPQVTGDCGANRERIEFSERNPAQPVGSEVWVGWSLFLPADFPVPRGGDGPNITLGQFHQRDDSGPELLFNLRRTALEVELTDPTRRDDDPMNPIPRFRITEIVPTQALVGRWTRFVVNARWSRGNDGFVRVYVNGREAWSYDGPTTNSTAPIYFKYGIYRSFVSRCGGPCPDMTAYYTSVIRGSSRADVE